MRIDLKDFQHYDILKENIYNYVKSENNKSGISTNEILNWIKTEKTENKYTCI